LVVISEGTKSVACSDADGCQLEALLNKNRYVKIVQVLAVWGNTTKLHV